MNPFSFLLTGLSSLSAPSRRLIPRALSNVAFYRNAQGYLIPLIAGSFHYVSADDEFVIGLWMYDTVLAIYDSQRRQVLVRKADVQNVVMTEELHEEYDEYFVRLLPPSPPRLPPSAPNHRPRQFRSNINRH